MLGMEWLASLSETRVNFKELTLMLPIDGKRHILKEEPGVTRTAASLKAILNTINDQGQGFLLQCQSL